MDGPQPINHRHAAFQSNVGRLLVLYFNKLAGRPLPNLPTMHNNAGLSHAKLTRSKSGRTAFFTNIWFDPFLLRFEQLIPFFQGGTGHLDQ